MGIFKKTRREEFIRKIVKKLNLGRTFVHEVVKEKESFGFVVDPMVKAKEKNWKRGVGVFSLNAQDDKLQKNYKKIILKQLLNRMK